jgi:hypothetical protein
MRIKHIGLFTTILTLTTSCSTYYLTTDSLRNQFSGVDSTKLRTVTVRGPIGERYSYLANPINEIKCADKNGNLSRLANSPSIEMRVTETNGKRTIFYFDRIFVTDSTLTGIQSRFISSINKTIKLKDIKKLEIQDGKKNFDYVSK